LIVVSRESKQGAIKEKGPRIQVDITPHNALQTGGEVGVILKILDPLGKRKATFWNIDSTGGILNVGFEG
jgi:hypothetical protein